LNCNKIKSMKITAKDIADALKDSDKVEVHKDKNKIRRMGNEALPERPKTDEPTKKRDLKAKDKEETKEKKKDGHDEDEKPELDEKGNILMVEQDFENPMIVQFKTPGKEGDKNLGWKEVVEVVKAKHPNLKITYSRADQFSGEIAISSHKLKDSVLNPLLKEKIDVQGRDVTFAKLAGEELKSFW